MQQQKAEKVRQVTEFHHVDEEFLSQYGRVTYHQWCRHEVRRLANHSVLAGIRQNGSAQRVAVFALERGK